MNHLLASVVRVLCASDAPFSRTNTPTIHAARAAVGHTQVRADALANDIALLNYALMLEHFEAMLHRTIMANGVLTGLPLTYAKTYSVHEKYHVSDLTFVITTLGGTPVPAQATYYLPPLTIAQDILNLMVMVEEVITSAYLGVVPLIQMDVTLDYMMAIHTVEAQHATMWRALTGMDMLPVALATPRTRNEVLELVLPFLQPIHIYLPFAGT